MPPKWMLLLSFGLLLLPIVGLILLSITARPSSDVGWNAFEARNQNRSAGALWMLAECPETPNGVCSQATDSEHKMDALTFTTTPETAWENLIAALGKLSETATIVHQEQQEDYRYLHVEFRTSVFRFIDDGEFVWNNTEGEKQTIQFRSVSRAGHSDLGKNRQRMDELRTIWTSLMESAVE